MNDHIERAAQVLRAYDFDTPEFNGFGAARALDDAGLLRTDADVANAAAVERVREALVPAEHHFLERRWAGGCVSEDKVRRALDGEVK